jgi:hypothetical protein
VLQLAHRLDYRRDHVDVIHALETVTTCLHEFGKYLLDRLRADADLGGIDRLLCLVDCGGIAGRIAQY